MAGDENGYRCSHRDELIFLFLKFKAQWVAPSRRKQVGYPEPECPNGTVPLESYFYIERDNIESRCYQEIKKPGALIRIKASKFMGKTSLMSRIFAEAQKQENIRIVEVNLTEADQEILDSSQRFLRWFCLIVGKRLNLENQLERYWDDSSGGSILNCKEYFEQYLLPQLNCHLVLGLDEVERIFPYPKVAPDFFSLLRLCHENVKTQPTSIWRNLRLIIAHSTEVYVQLKSTESPFNVGIPISLPDFSPEQVKTLAIRHN